MKLKVESLNLNFENFSIKDINLEFHEKDIVGIVGKNGSGKTTLLKCISGILPSKSIYIDDQLLTDKNRNQICFMESTPFFYELLTVSEMISLVKSICNTNIKTYTYIQEVIEQLDLKSYKSNLIRNLSLGTRQKLSFVLSLLNDSPIVLLDEPFNGIDTESMLKIKDIIIKKAQIDKNIILLSTHRIDLVNDICTKYLVIENGRLIKEESVYKKL